MIFQDYCSLFPTLTACILQLPKRQLQYMMQYWYTVHLSIEQINIDQLNTATVTGTLVRMKILAKPAKNA